MSSYFRYRHNDQPDISHEYGIDIANDCYDDAPLLSAIRQEPSHYYSDFVTRFTVDLARVVLPAMRAFGSTEIRSQFLAEKTTLDPVIARATLVPQGRMPLAKWFVDVGDTVINAQSYPLSNFFRQLKNISDPTALWRQLKDRTINGMNPYEAVELWEIFQSVFEGHCDLLSPEALTAIRGSWLHADAECFCDTPFPNLIINSLLGTYGNPCHLNTRGSARFSYTAKAATMYTDVFSFDRARYFYEWFPTIQLAPSRFESRAFRILARCIIDRLGRTDWSCSSHPFRGAAVAGLKEIPAAEFYEIPTRVAL